MRSALIVYSSNVQSLRNGILKTSKNVQVPYTILLVGETGVGKSSVLEFIANVLIGNSTDHYKFDILDYSNEQGGSANQSQTNSARVYNLMSNNEVLVSASVYERND
jgi:ATP-dependent Clp protease ATP-binding subunit ClpA